MAGTQQELNITGGLFSLAMGDAVVLTKSDVYPFCFNDGTMDGPATATKSQVVVLTNDKVQILPGDENYKQGRRTQLVQPFVFHDTPKS